MSTPLPGHKNHDTLWTDSYQESHGVMVFVVGPSKSSFIHVYGPFTEAFEAAYDDHTSIKTYLEGYWHC